MKKKIIVISILLAVMILAIQNTIFAATSGTINVHAVDSDGLVAWGLEMAIYKIGTTDNFNFTYDEQFKECGLNVSDLSSENIIKFEQYAKKNATPFKTNTTNGEGKFTENNLEYGVYLFVQNNKFNEYKMQTMLVELPEVTVDGINDNLTVKPKISPIYGEGGYEAEPPVGRILPDTGVLNWPIPVLTASGIALFAVTWVLFYSKKKVK